MSLVHFVIGTLAGFIAGIYAMFKIDKVSEKEWRNYLEWKKENRK